VYIFGGKNERGVITLRTIVSGDLFYDTLWRPHDNKIIEVVAMCRMRKSSLHNLV